MNGRLGGAWRNVRCGIYSCGGVKRFSEKGGADSATVAGILIAVYGSMDSGVDHVHVHVCRWQALSAESCNLAWRRSLRLEMPQSM
jgi:hypothetical protein